MSPPWTSGLSLTFRLLLHDIPVPDGYEGSASRCLCWLSPPVPVRNSFPMAHTPVSFTSTPSLSSWSYSDACLLPKFRSCKSFLSQWQGRCSLVRLGSPPFLCPTLPSKACDLSHQAASKGRVGFCTSAIPRPVTFSVKETLRE